MNENGNTNIDENLTLEQQGGFGYEAAGFGNSWGGEWNMNFPTQENPGDGTARIEGEEVEDKIGLNAENALAPEDSPEDNKDGGPEGEKEPGGVDGVCPDDVVQKFGEGDWKKTYAGTEGVFDPVNGEQVDDKTGESVTEKIRSSSPADYAAKHEELLLVWQESENVVQLIEYSELVGEQVILHVTRTWVGSEGRIYSETWSKNELIKPEGGEVKKLPVAESQEYSNNENGYSGEADSEFGNEAADQMPVVSVMAQEQLAAASVNAEQDAENGENDLYNQEESLFGMTEAVGRQDQIPLLSVITVPINIKVHRVEPAKPERLNYQPVNIPEQSGNPLTDIGPDREKPGTDVYENKEQPVEENKLDLLDSAESKDVKVVKLEQARVQKGEQGISRNNALLERLEAGPARHGEVMGSENLLLSVERIEPGAVEEVQLQGNPVEARIEPIYEKVRVSETEPVPEQEIVLAEAEGIKLVVRESREEEKLAEYIGKEAGTDIEVEKNPVEVFEYRGKNSEREIGFQSADARVASIDGISLLVESGKVEVEATISQADVLAVSSEMEEAFDSGAIVRREEGLEYNTDTVEKGLVVEPEVKEQEPFVYVEEHQIRPEWLEEEQEDNQEEEAVLEEVAAVLKEEIIKPKKTVKVSKVLSQARRITLFSSRQAVKGERTAIKFLAQKFAERTAGKLNTVVREAAPINRKEAKAAAPVKFRKVFKRPEKIRVGKELSFSVSSNTREKLAVTRDTKGQSTERILPERILAEKKVDTKPGAEKLNRRISQSGIGIIQTDEYGDSQRQTPADFPRQARAA